MSTSSHPNKRLAEVSNFAKNSSNRYSALSLFSGAGGMDLGFERAGFQVKFANDADKHACASYSKNFETRIVCGPVEELDADLKKFSGVDCMFGGPPCQGFSVAGKMDLTDPRSKLVLHFINALKIVNPRCFVMENVPSLATLKKFVDFRKQLFSKSNELGYETELVILNSADFGVPQARKRMFLIGIKKSLQPNILLRSQSLHRQKISTKEAIKHLGVQGTNTNPKTCNANITIAQSPVLRRSAYAGMLFNGLGRPINPDVPAPTLPASMGGNKTPIIDERHYYGDGYSWIEEYHQDLRRGLNPKGMVETPASFRRLTLKEAATLHSFPNEFLFEGPKTSVYSQIGNAVPPVLAEAVAKTVIDTIENQEVGHAINEQIALKY